MKLDVTGFEKFCGDLIPCGDQKILSRRPLWNPTQERTERALGWGTSFSGSFRFTAHGHSKMASVGIQLWTTLCKRTHHNLPHIPPLTTGVASCCRLPPTWFSSACSSL